VRVLIEHLETAWEKPDDGIWEVRGPRRRFVRSKVMAWPAFDCAVDLAERFELEAPVERWKEIRARIHRQVCEQGYDQNRGTFTQYYGSQELDAAVLMIPIVGFLPATDYRVTGTIDAPGPRRFRLALLVLGDRRRPTRERGSVPGLLVLARHGLAMNGRVDEARGLFERLLSLGNDLGLFSEEYDVANQRLIGNLPQAFTHLTLVMAAKTLTNEDADEPKRRRGGPIRRSSVGSVKAAVNPCHRQHVGSVRSQAGRDNVGWPAPRRRSVTEQGEE
jgi:Glycosyl hydrolases family 15